MKERTLMKDLVQRMDWLSIVEFGKKEYTTYYRDEPNYNKLSNAWSSKSSGQPSQIALLTYMLRFSNCAGF